MGYYADTDWNITFHSPEAEQAAYAELRAELDWTIDEDTCDEDTWLLANIGENAEQHRDGLNLTGWTSGKYFHRADKGIMIIAKYADGEIELDASDSGDGYGKFVLSGGSTRWVHGYIAYRDDRSPWDEIDGAPVADWQYEVANGDTRLGYLAWADAKKEQEGAA